MGAKPTPGTGNQPADLSSLCLEHAPLPMATFEGASRLIDKPKEQLVENRSAKCSAEVVKRPHPALGGRHSARMFRLTNHHLYRIDKSIRDCCVFARQNLTTDPPFSDVDLRVAAMP